MLQPASEESIIKLIDNLERTINAMYVSAKYESLVLSTMAESSFFKNIVELKLSIHLMFIDIFTEEKYMLIADNEYMKRFHMKCIKTSLTEAYKGLFGWRKKSRSMWGVLEYHLLDKRYDEIRVEYKKIKTNLDMLGTKYDFKEVRDQTVHYSEDIINMYEVMYEQSSEDEVLRTINTYIDVFHSMLLFCDKIVKNENVLCSSKINQLETFSDFTLHELAKRIINTKKKLSEVFEKTFPYAVNQWDCMAQYRKKVDQIKKNIETKFEMNVNNSGLDNIILLWNIDMSLRFMLLDFMTILYAYLKSSVIESIFIIRRIVIEKTASFGRLYGYDGNTKDRENSLWNKIKMLVPLSNVMLKSQLDEITTELDEMSQIWTEKENRHLYVHLIKDRKELPVVLLNLEQIDPLIYVNEITRLIVLVNKINLFVVDLMKCLQKDACMENAKSTEQDNEKIKSFERLFDDILDGKDKNIILESMDKIRRMVDNI